MEQNKFITRATRDKNIRVFEAKKGKIKKPLTKKPEKKITRGDIERAMKPRTTSIAKRKTDKPWLIMKPQEKMLLETDLEVPGFLEESYWNQKKFDDGLKGKGDYKRETMPFGYCRRCPRYVFYDFFEPHKARPYTTKGLILFDDGKLHHKNIQSRLDEMGKLKESEGWLHIEEIHANGRYDGLVPVGQDGKWCICDVLEIKSKPIGLSKVAQEDYDQAQLYLKASKDSPSLIAAKIKTRNIRILYKDRSLISDDIHLGWIARPDIERQDDIMEYMRFLWNVVYKQKKLIPHPYERKSNNCKWCVFHEHCWQGFAWEPKEADVSEIMEVETPTGEIVKSFANRLYAILKDEKKLKEEKDTLIPALLKYFIKSKISSYPIAEGEGLAVSQSKLSEWDVPGLIKAIGLEMFSKIGKPDGKKITDLIKTEYIDASKFEQFKKYKMSKPSIRIGKVKNG